MWHFIPNPFSLEESLVTIDYYGYSAGTALIEFNGWGLPDISIMEHAPQNICYICTSATEKTTLPSGSISTKLLDTTLKYMKHIMFSCLCRFTRAIATACRHTCLEI